MDKTSIKKLIPRRIGEAKGNLRNKEKAKVFRDRKRFYLSNRMLLKRKKAQQYYASRWKIEESFRFLKSCIGLNGCQQHRTIFQEIFIWMCLITFAYFSFQESFSDDTIYKCFHNVIFGDQEFDYAFLERIFSDQ
jgi:IS4 transposase